MGNTPAPGWPGEWTSSVGSALNAYTTAPSQISERNDTRVLRRCALKKEDRKSFHNGSN
jgi:hypothetical protein